MKRPCLFDACWRLVDKTYCDQHKPAARPRPSPTARGYDAAYRRARLRVLQAAGWRCAYCGGPANAADHVIPRSKGGTNAEGNLVACCTSCNSRKGATT